MTKPTLSIIIPVYNAAEYISNIIQRILDQDFNDFELLLIDDGSNDNSLNIINEFSIRHKNITVYSKKNGGPSSARNFGLERAKGKYIQFYDSDDDILPGALSTIIKVIRSSDVDMVISGWQINTASSVKPISPDGCIVRTDLTNFILQSIGNDGTLYNLWNKLFRADIIHENNLRFREDVWFGEDLMFAFEYFKHIRSLKIIPNITYNYYTDNNSSVFRASSIIPKYRHINDIALGEFVGKSYSEKTKDLYHWVRWRWLLSYWMLVSKSNNPLRLKIALIKQGVNKGLIVAKSSRYIGKNKHTLEKTINYLIRHPLLALIFASILSWIKRIMV